MNTTQPDAARLALRANRLDLLERLTDDLAHEIKNPLHSIVINLEVLKRRIARCGAADTDEMTRYIRVLEAELERVNGRLDTLLRLHRPRTGVLASLHDCVDDLLDVVELETAQRRVAFRYEPSNSTPAMLTDAAAVQQLILNLVFDALDALDASGATGTLFLREEGDEHVSRLVVNILPDDAAPLRSTDKKAAAEGMSPRLQAARVLGQHLGGRVEVLSNGAAPGDSPSPPGLSLLLSLPVG